MGAPSGSAFLARRKTGSCDTVGTSIFRRLPISMVTSGRLSRLGTIPPAISMADSRSDGLPTASTM